jgi:uncharacterized membrane protein
MFHDCVVAVYDSLDKARHAIQMLEEAHVPHDRISLVTHDIHRQVDDERTMQFGDKSESNAFKGAGFGGLFGLLLGAPLLAIPGVGPILLAGPLAAGITGAIVGGFLGSMSGWGVHTDHIREYEHRVRAGAVLVVVNGTPQEVADAQRALQDTHAEEVVLHAKASDETPEVDDRPGDLMQAQFHGKHVHH